MLPKTHDVDADVYDRDRLPVHHIADGDDGVAALLRVHSTLGLCPHPLPWRVRKSCASIAPLRFIGIRFIGGQSQNPSPEVDLDLVVDFAPTDFSATT